MISLLGSDEMMFDFNSHLLVNEIVMNGKDNQQKIVELDWVPIINGENDEIDKIMVTIKDVTELRSLQLEAESQKKELEIIGQILAVGLAKFKDFVNTSFNYINECRDLINNNQQKDLAVIAHLFRNMHTVKGNARTYGFKFITDSVHQVEHSYDELRKNEEKQWQPDELLAELVLAEKDIQFYKDIAINKLGDFAEGDDPGLNINNEKIQLLISEALALDLSSTQSTVKSWIDNAYKTLAGNVAKPMSQVITHVVESVYSLAGDLGKEKPQVAMDDGDLLIKTKVHGLLNDVFMHVFRNSMDHGIEKPEERLHKGKSANGHIYFKTYKKGQQVVFEVNDDGNGMAIKHLYENALKNGIYQASAAKPSPQEIANLVFHSGFSTAKEVTDISGRGVGMDAVKQFLEKAGGTIEIVLTQQDANADFLPFITRITLNQDCCLDTLNV